MRRLLSGSALALALLSLPVIAGAASAGQPDEVQPLASATVVVNEISTRGPNGTLDEFIEIRNISNNPVDLTGYTMRVFGPQNALVDTITLPAGIVLSPKGNSGQFLVLTSQNFSGTIEDETNVVPFLLAGPEGIPVNGGVAVVSPTGTRVDGIAFSASVTAAKEGQPALPETQVTEQLAASSSRDIVSTDTDNNRQDFSLHQRTPGQLN